jgi:hypothetical protein
VKPENYLRHIHRCVSHITLDRYNRSHRPRARQSGEFRNAAAVAVPLGCPTRIRRRRWVEAAATAFGRWMQPAAGERSIVSAHVGRVVESGRVCISGGNERRPLSRSGTASARPTTGRTGIPAAGGHRERCGRPRPPPTVLSVPYEPSVRAMRRHRDPARYGREDTPRSSVRSTGRRKRSRVTAGRSRALPDATTACRSTVTVRSTGRCTATGPVNGVGRYRG